jgi:AcrR family transcriptional regulator
MPTAKPDPRRPAAQSRPAARWGDAIPDRERQFQLKREALLTTAARLFNERGFHNTSLADLAKALHVTKPALYYYVKDKDAILLECQRLGTRQLDEAAHAAQAAAGRGIDRLRVFVQRYAEAGTGEFATCVIRSGPHTLHPEARPEILRARRKIERTLEAIIRGGIADGSIAPCDVKMSAFSIFGALHWMCFWYREGGALRRSEIAERMMGLFAQGLEPRAVIPAAGRRPWHGTTSGGD